MLKRLLDFIKHPTSLNIFINTFGNYLNVFFTAFYAVLITRVLNAVDYGSLSVLLSVVYVFTNILDLGTTASIYSYLPALVEKKHKDVGSFLKTVFTFQSSATFIVIILLGLTFPFFDKMFLKTHASPVQFSVTALSIIFLVWQNFLTNAMNAAKEFLKVNVWSNVSNVAKAVIFVPIIFFHLTNIAFIIFTFGIFGPLVFIILVLVDQKKYFVDTFRAVTSIRQLRIRYTLTFFGASQFLNMSQRVDIFLLSFFMPRSPDIGYYGLAQKIILNIITAIVSITQVLSPNFSKIKDRLQLIKELKHAVFYMSIPAALFVVLYLTPSWIFSLVFTHRYDSAISITRSLSLPFLMFVLVNIPILFLLYSVKKPFHILIAYFLIFVVIAVGCY